MAEKIAPNDLDGVVWINGHYADFRNAQVSLEDRGFVFGDGVYEVARVYEGKVFAWQEHMDRLVNSAAGIELPLPLSIAEITSIANDLLARRALSDAEIYIQITRGAARRNHAYPEGVPPTTVIGVRPFKVVPSVLWERGMTAITVPDERWARCNLKTICLLPNCMAKEHALRAGADEAIMIRDGFVTEGTTCNVFLWNNGHLITPITDNRILPGITRAVTLRIARERGYEVVERNVVPEDLFGAQEVFLTSTSVELMPVVKIDDRTIGNGRPGDIRGDLHSAFKRLTAGQD